MMKIVNVLYIIEIKKTKSKVHMHVQLGTSLIENNQLLKTTKFIYNYRQLIVIAVFFTSPYGHFTLLVFGKNFPEAG